MLPARFLVGASTSVVPAFHVEDQQDRSIMEFLQVRTSRHGVLLEGLPAGASTFGVSALRN